MVPFGAGTGAECGTVPPDDLYPSGCQSAAEGTVAALEGKAALGGRPSCVLYRIPACRLGQDLSVGQNLEAIPQCDSALNARGVEPDVFFISLVKKVFYVQADLKIGPDLPYPVKVHTGVCV